MVKLKIDGEYCEIGFLSFVRLYILAYLSIALTLFVAFLLLMFVGFV